MLVDVGRDVFDEVFNDGELVGVRSEDGDDVDF